MWYVQAILILTLILMISNKKAYRYILLILLFIVFIIRNVQYNTFFDGLNIIFDDIFRGDLNFLSKGIYFISGFCLYDMYSFWQLNSKNKRILIGALALGYFFEVLNIRYDFMLASILHLLMAIGLFIICYNTHSCLDGNKLLEFRKESTVIYFTHVIVKYCVQFIFIYFYRENETLIWLVTVVLLIIWSKFLLHTEHGMKLYKLLY